MKKQIDRQNYAKAVIWDILIDCFCPDNQPSNNANTSIINKIDIDAHENFLQQVDKMMYKIEQADLMKFVHVLLNEVNTMMLEDNNYKFHTF